MSIFDSLGKKKTPEHNMGEMSSESPILGREAQGFNSSSTAENMDDDLPSVNRRSKSGKLLQMVGSVAVAGAGALMLYYINTDDAPKVAAEKPRMIANHLPPLEVPQLPAPERPPQLEVPEVSTQPTPVPLQQQPPTQAQAQPASNQPKQPTWLERRMAGNLVINGTATATPAGTSPEKLQVNNSPADAPTPLALRLKSTISPGVSAALLPNRDFLITKGTSLDCALETAIDSTVPGITTCRITRDIYSDNGHVVLLDRGSQLVGEYQGGLTAGQARIFVLWTRAKTPNGVVVALESPGTDTLGRAGHAGWVDTHFPERFGAAILLSLVKDALAIARNKNTNGQVQIGGGGSDQLATEVLKNTINIPPTLYVNQGDHIQIMVARDLDFSSVYGLDLKE